MPQHSSKKKFVAQDIALFMPPSSKRKSGFSEADSRLPENNSKQCLSSVSVIKNESKVETVKTYLSRSQNLVRPTAPEK